jgi:hypothetical protein
MTVKVKNSDIDNPDLDILIEAVKESEDFFAAVKRGKEKLGRELYSWEIFFVSGMFCDEES